MPSENKDAVMAVIEGSSTPNANWTSFPNENICARRVAYDNVRRLHAINRKVVGIYIFQEKVGQPDDEPNKIEINGWSSYSAEFDVVNDCLRLVRYSPSGNPSGARRRDFFRFVNGGGASGDEEWPSNMGQVPTQGVSWLDADPSTQMMSDANALTTADVPLT